MGRQLAGSALGIIGYGSIGRHLAPIAKSLGTFSDALRTQRRQQAEEMAAKTTIKLVPPLVFFIFPSMGVVVVGPAVIAVADFLAHFLR